MTAGCTIAQTSLFGELLPWLLALAGLLAVGAVVVFLVRRSTRSTPGGGGAGFTLHDLRTLHARGELSDEEFERAKGAMIGRVRGGPPRGGRGAGADDEPPGPEASAGDEPDR